MGKIDVQEFTLNLEDNLFQLHKELVTKTYRHSHYTSFYITDPKLRHIHKACVRDRVLHHAIFRVLYSIFNSSFVYDSFSCRVDKGTHRAVDRLEYFARKMSANNSRNIHVLKCDIKKFFNSVDHEILLSAIKRKVNDQNAVWLLEKIIESFNKDKKRGLPIGNVTSQLFANIYLNELDRFAKHRLKAKYYIRYCDDFVILIESKEKLIETIKIIGNFLNENLNLLLHSDKIIIRKYRQGIDFLGYIVLPYHRVLRIRTKKRIFKKLLRKKKELEDNLISEASFNQSIQSYLGILKHCNSYGIEKKLLEIIS